jgi:hypothetical protein
MKNLSCAATQRRLSAFCDGELTLKEQVAVDAHLKECAACTAEAGLIDEIGRAVRALASGPERSDLAALQAAVLPRIKAERKASLAHQIEDLFEDMHLVWAAGCGIAAMLICGLTVFGLVHDVNARPDSLAAVFETLSHGPAARLAAEPLVLPRAFPDAVMPATVMNQQGGEDAVFALAAVVTQDGSLSEIELLSPTGQSAAESKVGQSRLTDDLLDAASTARFEPARSRDGAAMSMNVVWVLTHTTVRGKSPVFRPKVAPVAPAAGRPIGWRPITEPSDPVSLVPAPPTGDVITS